MRKQSMTLAALCTATALGLTGIAPANAAAPTSTSPTVAAQVKPADFNADGYPDLAISAEKATVNGLQQAGAVSVVYGSATGFQHDKASVITRATAGVPGNPSAYAEWGDLRGHGDLDRDGYDDLLVDRSATLLVLWGSKQGITGASTNVPNGAATAMPPGPNRWLTFAVGDVNGDGTADILSATQGKENLGEELVVEYGPFSRTTGKPRSFVTHDILADHGHRVMGGQVGDLTGDGITDVMAYGFAKDGKSRTTIFKGTRDGLVKTGSVARFLNGEIGDINGDGFQDIAGEALVHYTTEGGRVFVTYGGPDGVSTTLPSQRLTQNSPGVPGVNEAGDHFGEAVDVADVDGDGYADLLIGAPREIGPGPKGNRSGAITMLRGSKTGITSTGAKSFTQNSAGIPSTSEIDDKFGSAIKVLDSDKNGKPEVYVGGYGEDSFAGRVWKLKTDSTGVIGTGATSFTLADLGGPKGLSEFGHQMHG
ncbi:FG-GAP and VCBS repeat-containing protein [Streptomyces sp. NPDC056773]|uniref:FG-GAP and VCBS repeat-containing protein n=1 Tax=unclassified Streptomyces TaxID=2593676 RepID=UPI00367A20F6